MKNSQLPVRIGNEIQIDIYVAEIKNELGKSLSAWNRISEIFAAAQNQFGRKSKPMVELAKETGFSIAKIDKLVQIANSKFLKSSPELFSKVNTWTVLYDVTLLDENQFNTLKSKLLSGESLTSRLVTSIRKPKPTEITTLRQFVTIQLDINAIRTGMIDAEDYEQLICTLQSIAEKFPFIKITMNDLMTADSNKRQEEFMDEIAHVMKKEFNEERKKYLNRVKVNHGNKYCKIRKSELRELTNDLKHDEDYAAAFEMIESDQFDQKRYYNEASFNFLTRREEKFTSRLPEPYAYNTIIVRQSAA